MSTILLSHSSKDNAVAGELKNWLEARGHSVFLDFDPEAGIKGGAGWEQTLYDRLRRCRVVIPLLTQNWLLSKWCFAEVVHARSNGKAIVPLKVAECDAGAVFPDIQQIDLIGDPQAGFRRLDLALQQTFPWDPSRPPYPGLLTFQEDDAAIFFGRGPETCAAIETLEGLRRRDRAAPRFLLVLGPSGSGKSSLMRAGVIPRLRAREGWLPVAAFRPREDPISELATALAATYELLDRPRNYTEILGSLQKAAGKTPTDGSGLLPLVRDLAIKAQRGDVTVLITVDQAEELFAECGGLQADQFLGLMRAALQRADGRLMAVATMRSEFLGAFQTNPFLVDPHYPEPFAYAEITVDPLPVDRFTEVIRGPADLAGISFDEALVERMVADTGTRDALPLLAYTLRRLWDNEAYRADARFELREYQELGGLEGSICEAADEALGAHELQTDQLDALRAAFVPALVRVGTDGARVRRRAYRDELPRGVEKPIKRFIDARLLVTGCDREGRETVEVAHEALLRVWPHLDAWLEQDQEKLRLLASVQTAARDWQLGDRVPDLLLHRGDRLAEALALAHEPRFAPRPESMEADYLSACEATQRAREAAEREERERRIRDAERIAEGQRKVARRTFAGLLAALVLALGAGLAGWVAWNKANEAEMQRVEAEHRKAEAVQRKAEAEQQRTEANQARARAEEARTLAEKQARVALSRQLAAEARAIAESYPQRALLLAVEALRRPQEADGVRLPGPETVLRDLLSTIGGLPLHGLHGFDREPDAVAFDPKGRWLAIRGDDGSVRLWSLADPEAPPLILAEEGSWVQALGFDPLGRWLAAGSGHGRVSLWDLSDPKGKPKVLSRSAFAPLAFDGTGRWLAAGSEETVRVWDLKDLGAEPKVLRGHGSSVTSVAFDTDGRWLATGSGDPWLQLWDLRGPEPTRVAVRAHSGLTLDNNVLALKFGARGHWLACGISNGTVRLWDMGDLAAAPVVLRSHRNPVATLAFDPQARWLATGSGGEDARLWDLESLEAEPIVLRGQVEPSLIVGSTGPAIGLAFDPKGRWVATGGDSTVRLWKLADLAADPNILRGHEGEVVALSFDSQGRWLATLSEDKNVRLWHLTSAGVAPIVLRGHKGAVSSLAFDPQRRWLATAAADRTVRLWDQADLTGPPVVLHEGVDTGQLLFDPVGRWLAAAGWLWDLTDPGVRSGNQLGQRTRGVPIALDALGGWFATAGIDKTMQAIVRLWDLTNLETAPVVLRGHRRSITTLALEPRGRWLATGSLDDGTVRLWDLTNLSADPMVLLGRSDKKAKYKGPWQVAFDRQGRSLAAALEDMTARVWDLTDLAAKPVVLRAQEGGGGMSVVFDPLRRWLATGRQDGTTHLWNLDKLTAPPVVLRGHDRWKGLPKTLAFDPQGHWLATGAEDGTARLWDLTNLGAAVVLRGHERAASAVAFDPDGNWLATGSSSGTVRLWDLRIENLLNLACRTAGRSLSEEEWGQYMGGLEYRPTCPPQPSGAAE